MRELPSVDRAVSVAKDQQSPTGPTAALRRKAETIARRIIESIPTVQGICLFGSVARGDSNEFSDIDLLVIGSDPALTPSKLLNVVPRRDRLPRVSLLYYTEEDFREQYDEGALFVAHIRSEGEILFDRSGFLSRLLSNPFTPHLDIQDAIETQLSRLEPYDDTRRFNGTFLFCLASLYAVGKGVVMLRLVEAGSPEFNRERAFAKFGNLFPKLRTALRAVTRLRPFFNLVTRRDPEPLPFAYRNAEPQVRETLRAIRQLARRPKNE